MASNPGLEVLSARMGINLVFTRVSGIFRSSTSFLCPESFSAPKGARKCLSPTRSTSEPCASSFLVKHSCLNVAEVYSTKAGRVLHNRNQVIPSTVIKVNSSIGSRTTNTIVSNLKGVITRTASKSDNIR